MTSAQLFMEKALPLCKKRTLVWLDVALKSCSIDNIPINDEDKVSAFWSKNMFSDLHLPKCSSCVLIQACIFVFKVRINYFTRLFFKILFFNIFSSSYKIGITLSCVKDKKQCGAAQHANLLTSNTNISVLS